MSVVMNDPDDPKKPEAEKPNVEGAEATDEAFISEDDLNTFEGWLKYQASALQQPPRRGWRSCKTITMGSGSAIRLALT
jgi:hypothetical protein